MIRALPLSEIALRIAEAAWPAAALLSNLLSLNICSRAPPHELKPIGIMPRFIFCSTEINFEVPNDFACRVTYFGAWKITCRFKSG